MLGKGKKNNARGEGGRDRGRQGGRGGYDQLHTHRRGPADPGGLRIMGALQRWSAPQWRYFKRQRLADVMDNSGGHTHAALRRAQRVSWAPLHVRARCRTHRSPAAPLEHRDVHHHPDGNPPALPARDQPQRDRAKNRPPSGCMGSGGRLRYWWRIRRTLARSISPLLGVRTPWSTGRRSYTSWCSGGISAQPCNGLHTSRRVGSSRWGTSTPRYSSLSWNSSPQSTLAPAL